MKDYLASQSDNTTKPWLSVIVPIYNVEKYLQKCLSSIMNQTFTDYEVLLVDDGSTDSSYEICNRVINKDKRFRYLKKENGGSYQARIFGAERALGSFITFCDADDYYVSKNTFRCLYKEAGSGEHSAIQFGYIKKYNHMFKKCPVTNTPLDFDRNSFLTYEYPKLLCSFWDSAHLITSVCNKVYHRDLFSKVPPSDSVERVFWGDDLIMNLYLLSTCESFRVIPNMFYCYRQSSGGTKKFSMRTMKDLDTIKKHQIMFLDGYSGANKEVIRDIMFSEVAGWFFVYIQQGLDYLKEHELMALINESLCLPSFILAREYYLENTADNSDSVDLLRKADAHEYIVKAQEYHNKRKQENKLYRVMKELFTHI